MDNFDLKKFLKESKALENLNPTIKSLNETSFSDRGNTQDYDSSPKERPDGTYDISNIMKETLKAKIKEMIVAELEGAEIKETTDIDLMDPIEELNDPYDDISDDDPEDNEKSYYSHFQDLILDPSREADEDNPEEDDPEESEAEARDYNRFFQSLRNKIKEAKKKKDKDVEDVEDVEVTDTEDISLDDIPTSEETPEPSTGGGLEDIAADMKGTEADLMDHLMKSFQIAKGMNNEKLETQVGNTLKFFVSEYIGGGQD